MKGLILRHSVGVPLTVTALAACDTGKSAEPSRSAGLPPVTVVADIFSGRENPSWALEEPEVSRLADCLRSGSVGTDPSSPSKQDLDFRGFLVTGQPDPLPYSEATFAVDGVTAMTKDGPKVVSGCRDAYGILRASAKTRIYRTTNTVR